MNNNPTMNIQAYLEDTFRMIKDEPVILIFGGFLVQLLTILSLGIMAGPFLGGYILLIIFYLRDKKKPAFTDIFSGLQQFGRLFPYAIVLLMIFIGLMLLIVPGLLLATWWLYVLPLMVDRDISFGEAMRLSTNKVNETGFLAHLVFLLLISVIPMLLLNFISTMIPFLMVLKILLPPFQAGCLVSLYIHQFEPEKVEPATAHLNDPWPTPRGPVKNSGATDAEKPPESNAAGKGNNAETQNTPLAGKDDPATEQEEPKERN